MSYNIDESVKRLKDIEVYYPEDIIEPLLLDNPQRIALEAFLRYELERCQRETIEAAEKIIGEDTMVASHQCGGDFTTMCNYCQSEVRKNNFRKELRTKLQALKPPTHAEEKETV